MRYIDGPVKWGIIGCGDVCEVKSGPAFQKVPESSLVAVMRRNLAKAKDFANRHHVPTWYDDAAQLINDPNVNAIYIATPPDSHEDFAIQAIKAGKPVYIEKPVAVTSEACRRIIAAAKQYQIPATVAHYRRNLAIFSRVKSLLEQGYIGNVRMVSLTLFQQPAPSTMANSSDNWRIDPTISGGGILFDLAPHQLDILYWLFGAPSTLKGLSINQGKSYDAPDVTSLTAVFDKNIFFQGLWSFNSPPHSTADSVKIIGDSGTLEFPFFASSQVAILKIHSNQDTAEEFIFPAHIQQPMIEQVVTYFQGKSQNPCSLEEALVTLTMMEVAYR